MKIIISENPFDSNSQVSITSVAIPSNIVDIDIWYEYVAKKSVPIGIPYVYVDDTQLPPYFLHFYKFDFTNPDGIGSGSFSNFDTGEFIDGNFNYTFDEYKIKYYGK
jgi:hypothetical protein